MNKIFIFLLLSITLFANTLKDVTIILPWKHQFQFAGYYAAKELGLYEKAGLNVTIKEYDLKHNNSKDISELKYEFGVGHSNIILEKINNYENLVFLSATHQSSPLILLSLASKNIHTINDIKNKIIMTNRNENNVASISAMLYSKGLRKDDYIEIETSFTPLDLINTSADMMISFSSNEPFFFSNKDIDYITFDPKDYGYDFYSDILFTSKEMLKENPKTVENFYQASMQGWEYAYQFTDKTIDLILEKYNTQNKSKKALQFEANTLRKLAFKDGVNFGDINYDRIKEIVNTYKLLQLVKKDGKITLNDYIYNPEYKTRFLTISKNQVYYEQLIKMLSYYKVYIFVFIFLLISTIIITLLFRYRLKSLLSQKTQEIDRNYEVYDIHISAIKTDLNGNITHATKAFCESSGYSKEELLGQNPKLLKADDSLDEISYKNLWLTITSGHTWRGEFKNIRKDGTEYWSAAVISPIFDINNKIVGYDGIRRDITLKKVLEDFNKKLEKEVKSRTHELQILATTDTLTSLYNRLYIDTELKKSVNNFKRYNKTFSIVLIDIDYFKKINDTHGHLVGDEVLVKLSEIMKKCIRNTDILGRWGGEEFMIIASNTNEDGTYKLAQYITKKIQEHIFDNIENITVSCGVAQIDSSLNENTIISKADKALYKAKELGRNRVER